MPTDKLTPEQIAHNREVARRAAWLAENCPNAFVPTKVRGEVHAAKLMRPVKTSRFVTHG